MSYSLNSFNRCYMGDCYGGYSGHARNVAYKSYRLISKSGLCSRNLRVTGSPKRPQRRVRCDLGSAAFK